MNGDWKLLYPRDGDMLSASDCRTIDGKPHVTVRISAPAGSECYVNGQSAHAIGGEYVALVPLHGYRSELSIHDQVGNRSIAATVYYMKQFDGCYRLSLDDNIWFLEDIARNARKYDSLFDNPYLAMYRDVHREFGTKVHINIYYQTEGFDLTQMPDKYKGQWQENADWLRLSFHALQDSPDMPYKDAGYDEMHRDCSKVLEQIRRFAGEELLGPVTTLHWGEATVDGCRALRDCGYRCQVGDFNVDNDLSPVSYYFDVEQRRHINRRSIWKDNERDIIFFRSAIITDCHKLDRIAPFLDSFRSEPERSRYVDLLIHEQYFYPRFFAYQPDYRQKVHTAARWAHENGYKPAFLSECVLE